MAEEIYPAGTDLSYGTAPFPFLRVSGETAVEAVERLNITHQDQTAVIWGDEEETTRLFELFDDPGMELPPASEILATAKDRTADELLSEYREQVRARVAAFYKRLEMPHPEDDPDGLHGRSLRGPWPENVQPHEQPVSLFDHKTQGFKKELLIGLIPTAHPWQIAAHLRFGNWNDCPPPAIHVAFAREWFEAHGARPILNGPDTIEFYVERPIQDRETAIAMAQTHHSYCSDIVDQGLGTIDSLAAHLMGAKYWYFWWD